MKNFMNNLKSAPVDEEQKDSAFLKHLASQAPPLQASKLSESDRPSELGNFAQLSYMVSKM